jgi:hypothetical protein
VHTREHSHEREREREREREIERERERERERARVRDSPRRKADRPGGATGVDKAKDLYATFV